MAIKDHLKEAASKVISATEKKITARVIDYVDLIMDKIDNRLSKTGDNLLKKIFGTLLILISSIFFILSAYFLMHDYFLLSRFLSSLILAMIVLILGFLIKYWGGKNAKNYERD